MNGIKMKDVVGHDDIKTHIINAAALDKVSHAYLFTGEDGSGKKMLASLFAEALNCERHTGEPCQMCRSCRKALTGNHPDIITVTHEKPNLFSVEEVRQQVVNTVDIKPYESRYKVYIIDEMEKMNPQAQNALLKTIEEPPEYVVLLLLTNSPDALLSTILSRCVRLDLKTVPSADVQKYLMTELALPDYEAEVITAFAQGNIGRAKRCVEDAEFIELLEATLLLVERIGAMQVYEFADEAKKLAEIKQNVGIFFDILTLWYRDVLLYKASMSTDGLVFKRNIAAIQSQADACTYEGIGDVLAEIEKAAARIRANVNFELVLEQLFLTIRDAVSA